ncbi:hypothetical protein [Chryseobacterium sp. R2A-55]|uniref:hypothetical protein n=1 Tax=Chryseobacterium sp. R2A-55 TaxID=2744445 RepID=UPI001F1DEDA1|nr:hypothetical protein [Chryseobacterium sp. R2A-55]
MKNLIITIAMVLSGTLFSQVIIGDNVGTASNKTSVLLEFANTNNKGIILPYVRTLASGPTQGSIVLDATDPINARVKYYNGSWVDLSGQGANVTSVLTSQPTAAAVVETADAKVIIGANTSTVTDGVLVLESTTKAMMLPQVSDVNNIPSPSPGMIVYVNKVGAKRLAVFNGEKWSFWKP